MGKVKGNNSERELVKLLKNVGFGCVRIAGSGKMDNAPDIIAGRPGVLLLIECKSTKKDAIYVNKSEIMNVIHFAEKFGGKPFYAFRFNRHPWRFISAYSLLKINKVTPNTGIEFKNFISSF